jgi:hypothetical protein
VGALDSQPLTAYPTVMSQHTFSPRLDDSSVPAPFVWEFPVNEAGGRKDK